MIALDAGVLIALFDANDVHHASADALFADHIDEAMTIGPINQAEVLVRAAQEGRDTEMLADLRRLGVSTTTLPDDAGTRLARLRAHTGAKMPGCCVLLTAQQTSARVATFDDQLGRIATSLGLGLAGPANRAQQSADAYLVRAVPYEHGWELHIEGEGVTQAHALEKAADQVRDHLQTVHPGLTVRDEMLDIRAEGGPTS